MYLDWDNGREEKRREGFVQIFLLFGVMHEHVRIMKNFLLIFQNAPKTSLLYISKFFQFGRFQRRKFFQAKEREIINHLTISSHSFSILSFSLNSFPSLLWTPQHESGFFVDGTKTVESSLEIVAIHFGPDGRDFEIGHCNFGINCR